MGLRWIQNPKVKGKQTMNKLIKMATMVVVVVGTAMCFTGCGKESPESEYAKLLQEGVKVGAIKQAGAESEMAKFKSMTPEQQKKAIEEAKYMVNLK